MKACTRRDRASRCADCSNGGRSSFRLTTMRQRTGRKLEMARTEMVFRAMSRHFAERNLWNIRCWSLRLNARELHHLGPFLNVLGDELAELGGRTCKRRVAKVCNPRFHRGIGENSIDLLVEFLDEIGGRIFWRADTQPRARIIARQKIVQ